MVSMMTPAEWRATLPDAQEFTAGVREAISGRLPVRGKLFVRMDELPPASDDVRALFTQDAKVHGWDIDFNREGGGPELLVLTSPSLTSPSLSPPQSPGE